MKIINLVTNNIFDLPKEEAKKMLKASPNEFAKFTKSKKIVKQAPVVVDENSILHLIEE